jgi:fibronectin type 3 domain-containing protein
MRRQEGAKQPTMVSEMPAGNEAMKLIDGGIEWEKKYDYWVIPVTIWQVSQTQKGEVEGDDSPTVAILAHDSFPPAAPSGLQAVFSGVRQQAFIDLTWTPNTEQDLAGYNIYRHTADTQPLKINRDVVKSPAFRDNAVQPGMKYFYSVSAVDLRGNESGRSPEASETVPQQ